MSSSHWEEFYADHLPPADFEDNRTLLKLFCERHNEDRTSIVLVTVCKKKIIFALNCSNVFVSQHFVLREGRNEREREKESILH